DELSGIESLCLEKSPALGKLESMARSRTPTNSSPNWQNPLASVNQSFDTALDTGWAVMKC
ncbi:MAG: hypothetical protein ACPGQF_10280, partial [Akkermansiaceae bacterium]